jgi:hypothetical protein
MPSVLLRRGNIFTNPCDLVVLPSSAKGTVSDWTKQHLDTHSIPMPTPHRRLGDVEVLPFPGTGNLASYVAFAAAVLNNYSSPETILEISSRVADLTHSNPLIRYVQVPLLGTGAGGLDSITSAEALLNGFYYSAHPLSTMHIHVPFQDVYDSLMRHFEGLAASIPSAKGAPQNPAEQKINSGLKTFLCHSSQDKEQIRRIYRDLKKAGMMPWLDEEHILPGQPWEETLKDAVRTADVVLTCLSSSSVTKKGYVQKEIREVLEVALELPADQIFVIPVRLDDCEVPRELRKWQYVDLFAENGFFKLLRPLHLCAQTKAARGQQ